MIKDYDIVTLPKGFRVYQLGNYCPSNPFFFALLHPSERYHRDTDITTIELQKEISLLFAIHHIHNMNLYKSQDITYKKFGNFDGWFSSINNKTSIEIVVINDPSILKIINTLPTVYDWINTTYDHNMKLIPKQWGENYSISSIQMPVKFILNSRFKLQIEEYQRQISEEDPFGTAFSILLNNAEITYFDAPLQVIEWSKDAQK